MPEFHLINFSPFATNVLDKIGSPSLFTQGGEPVELIRAGMGFKVKISGILVLETPDNLHVSYFLNSREVGERA